MSKVKLDLSKFKHVSSDHKTTKLRHQDGHFLVLAHGKLDKGYQDQLQALAEGGKVPVPETRQPDNKDRARAMMKGAQSGGPSMSQGIENVKKELKSVFGYAEGGSVYKSQDEYSDMIHKPEGQAEGNQGTTQAPVMEEGPEGYDNSVAPALEPDAPVPRHIAMQSIPQDIVMQQPGGQPQAQPAEVPKDTVEIQKIYNSIVSGNPNNSPFQVNTRPWATFGPNGEPPKAFDAQSYQQAEAMFNKQRIDAGAADAKKAQQIEADNAVRSRAGLPLLQVPGVNQPQVQPEAQPISEPQQQSMERPPESAQQGLGSSFGTAMDMMQSGYQQRLQGIEQQKEATQQLADDQAQIMQRRVEAQQLANNEYKSKFDALEAERQNHIADIQAGYIDPQKYWKNHSKVASAIGMIIAGFNPTERPNAAIDFLKYQMDQNLEAQKQNLGMKQNLLSANLRHFGNLRDAMEMTKVMQNDVMQHELQAAAAKANNPAAAAAAMDAAGKLKMESAQLFPQIAMRQAMAGLASNTNPQQSTAAAEHLAQMREAMGDHAGAKAMRERIVPGVGVSSIPVPENIREQITGYQNTLQQLKDVVNFRKQHPGAQFSPTDRQKAETLMLNLGNQIRVAEKMGVFKESEANLMVGMLGKSPASFFAALNTDPKIKEMLRLKEHEHNQMLKSYGLPQQTTTEQKMDPQAALKWAKANPKDPRAKQILKLLGQ